jgi:hypothetical protein
MNKTFKFGSTSPVTVKEVKRVAKKFAAGRGAVADSGPVSNQHAEYTTEVKFENIVPKVNVTRTKIDQTEVVGVLKGGILDGVPITVPSNTAGATMHAMKKRCDFSPSLNHLADFEKGHAMLMDKFEKLPEIRVDEVLFAEYLKKCAPGKADRLAKALAADELGTDMGTKHVFAKQEVLLKPIGAQPRIVYQGSDMYNALTGPVVMELNNRMKTVFSRSNPKNIGNIAIYACGASGEELGDAMESATGHAVESDAKNNDGSQSKEFRRPEAMFYAKLGAPLWFVREFASNTSVRVWTRYGVAATVDGQRWSGETSTTTGNSYVHMALMQSSLHKANIERSTNIHGGDDYLGFVDGDVKEFKASVESTYKTSGMVAEVVPQSSRHHATFYRKRYVRSPVGTLPVPQFGRVLAKLNIRANRNTAVNDRDYMAGKYLSAAYEHRHVPNLPELLIATSERLSDKPHLDTRQSKLAEMGGVDNIKKIVGKSRVHGLTEFGEFLNEVYGITYSDLFDVYARVAESCVEYCSAWTRVDKKGKIVNRSGNAKYKAPVLCGDTVAALARLDVGIE